MGTPCSSQKTLPNGIFLAERYFSSNPYAALPLVLYHLFQLLLDTALAGRLAGTMSGKESPAPRDGPVV